MKIQLAIVILFTMFGCKSTVSQNFDQGIKGKVLWLEGNFMPGPGQKNKGIPIERSIYIYPVIKAENLEKSGRFYKMPNIPPIKVVTSNAEGEFNAPLDTGKYTLLSKEEDGLYANLQDGQGNINPVEVFSNQFTDITFKIDYKAAY